MTVLKNINFNSDINATNDIWPAGMIIKSGGSVVDGWLPCAGQEVSRTTYTNLFGVISTTYGAGDGSTTFNLPDLRGRVESHANTMDTTVTGTTRLALGRGGIDGTEKVALPNVPVHQHGITGSMNQNKSHSHYFGLYTQYYRGGNLTVAIIGGPYQYPNYGTASTDINHTHNLPIEGASTPHDNMMPYLVVLALIKT